MINSILITGCNRGLGLGLVKGLLQLNTPPAYIISTCRDKEKAQELCKLAEENENLHVLEIDLQKFDQYEDFSKKVENIVKDNGLNVLFNNAGIAPKSTRLGYARTEDLIECFTTNTASPIMLTKVLLPLLKKASESNPALPLSAQRAAIINMSSVLASIELNSDGAMYAYRTSKAGLNAATKSMSIDLKPNNIMAVSMHPGWVRTDMGGEKAPLSVDTSCKKMIEVIQQLDEKSNGKLIQYDGKILPY